MKTLRFYVLALIAALTLASCEKDYDDPLRNSGTSLNIGDFIAFAGRDYQRAKDRIYDAVSNDYGHPEPFIQYAGDGEFLSANLNELGMTVGVKEHYGNVQSVNLHTDQNNPYGVDPHELYTKTYKYLNDHYGNADNGYGYGNYSPGYQYNNGQGLLGSVAIGLINDLARSLRERNGGQWNDGDRIITLSYHSHNFSLIVESTRY